MKRGTIEHPKMVQLAAALNIEHAHAVGIMESLWHWTSTYAMAGDIGRYPDALIADGIHWRKSPEKLISALVDCRWIDTNSGCRLVIHDWSDHAEESVHIKLSRKSEKFADGKMPRIGKIPVKERKNIEQGYIAKYPQLAEHFKNNERTDERLPERTDERLPERTDERLPERTASARTSDLREGEKRLANANANANANASPPNPQACGWEGEFLEALRETGKFPNLTFEALKQVTRDYPKAALDARWGEIVEEAKSLPSGVVHSPPRWIRAQVSALEARLVGKTSGQAGNSTQWAGVS